MPDFPDRRGAMGKLPSAQPSVERPNPSSLSPQNFQKTISFHKTERRGIRSLNGWHAKRGNFLTLREESKMATIIYVSCIVSNGIFESEFYITVKDSAVY